MSPSYAPGSLNWVRQFWGQRGRADKRARLPGGRRRRRRDERRGLQAESLEPRAMLAVTAALAGSELLVTLDEANDTAILQVEGGSYAIREGAQTVGTFSLAAVNSIRVTGDATKSGQMLFIKPGGVVADGLTVEAGVEATVVNAPIVTSGSVNIASAAITLAENVSSAGDQSYSGLVRLSNDVVLDAGAGRIHFGSEIRSTVGPRATLMEDLGAPNRLAAAPGGGVLYASDAVSNYVYFIDLGAQQLDTVDLGKSMGHVALSANGSRLYVANPLDGSVSVVDTASRAAVATISVPGTPEGMAFSPDGQTLYVANYSDDSVAVINTVTNRLTRTIPVDGSPTAVAVAADGRLWVASEVLNRVSVVDAATATVVAEIAVGRGPADIAISPDGTRAYVANNFDGTVSVIDTAAEAVAATIGVGSGPTELAATPDGRRVYVVNGFSDSVSVIDAGSLTVATTASVGSLPVGLALSADGNTAYVANLNSLSELGDDARSLTVRTTGTASFGAPPATVDPLRQLTVEAGQQVGPPPSLTVIEAVGNATLGYDPAGQLYANGALVTSGGNPVNYPTYASWGWSARAAETVDGINQIVWQNEAGPLQIWNLSTSWAHQSSLGDYAAGTADFNAIETDFGMDFDGDDAIGQPLTVIEAVGAVTLGYDSAGNLLANGTLVTSGGAAVNYNTYVSWGWTARAAETIGGVNKIVWQNEAGGLQLWSLSNSWAHQSSLGDYADGTATFNATEAAFGMDFDGDGQVAPATTLIESRGDIALEYDGSGNLRANGVLVTSGGGPVNYDAFRSWGWTARAAESVGGVNTIVWQNEAGELHFWRLSTSWVHEKSEGNFGPGSPQYAVAEGDFGVDLTGDGRITIESAGSVSLWYDAAGILRANDTLVTSGGNSVNYDLVRSWGWEAVAAEVVNTENSIAWRNRTTGSLQYWRLDSGWAHRGSDADDLPGSPGHSQAELDFQVDFDRDGAVGVGVVEIESRGSVVLERAGNGSLLANGTLVTSGGGPVNYFTFLSWGWTALAADVVGGVNTIAWQNSAGELHLWELSGDWAHTASRGNFAPGTNAFETARQALALDL